MRFPCGRRGSHRRAVLLLARVLPVFSLKHMPGNGRLPTRSHTTNGRHNTKQQGGNTKSTRVPSPYQVRNANQDEQCTENHAECAGPPLPVQGHSSLNQ